MSRRRFWTIVPGTGLLAGLLVGSVSGFEHGAAAAFVAAFGVVVFHARLFARPSELGQPRRLGANHAGKPTGRRHGSRARS